ncbi:MAG: hypothetical protein KY391_02540 [Actinobacteria bacterium]|nr:hypothetical protein [Actinomycetota bacterium]
MKRIRAAWASLWVDVDRRVRLGRIVGLTFVTIGFIFIFVAWNGSASKNVIMAQFPYVISGGIMGLALVCTGSLLLLLSTVRAERQIVSDKFDELAQLLGRSLAATQFSTNGGSDAAVKVIAASSHYHRQECKILEGKQGLTRISLQQAVSEGLQTCRVCEPPRLPEQDVGEAKSSTNGEGVTHAPTEASETRAQ